MGDVVRRQRQGTSCVTLSGDSVKVEGLDV